MAARPKQRPEALAQSADRILDSRRGAISEERDEKAEWLASDRESHGATSDPLTGRPPLLVDAEVLRKEVELQRLRNVQLTEGEEDIDGDVEEDDIEVILEDEEMADSGVIAEQEPGRMISAGDADDDDDEADDYGKSE